MYRGSRTHVDLSFHRSTPRFPFLPSPQLLLRLLPPELVLPILSFASYHSLLSTLNTRKAIIANASRAYLLSAPFPRAGRVEEVRIAVKSKDQGWSSYPGDYGQSLSLIRCFSILRADRAQWTCANRELQIHKLVLPDLSRPTDRSSSSLSPSYTTVIVVQASAGTTATSMVQLSLVPCSSARGGDGPGRR